MMKLWFDLVSLLFPDLCIICRKLLIQNEKHICIGCLFELPGTNYGAHPGNPILNQLEGIASFENAISLYYYSKSSILKKPIHDLKYHGKMKIGIKFGELLGDMLKNTPPFCYATMLVPVPLHPEKLKNRGYNQSKLIADGVASKLNVPVNEELLIRIKNSESQPHKNKWDREFQSNTQFEIHEFVNFLFQYHSQSPSNKTAYNLSPMLITHSQFHLNIVTSDHQGVCL